MMWAAGLVVHNVDGSPIPVNPNPAQVINMSLGSSSKCSQQYQDTINTVVGEGVVVVVAAGNEHANIKDVSPAGCSGVISVAAKGPTGKLAYYSNFGNTTVTASGGDRTILDPLSMVKSTTWSSLETYQAPADGGYGGWREKQGTSMATPHVSAAVAILLGIFKAQGKAYTHNELVAILQENTTKYDECNTHGCATKYALDVKKAVNHVLAPGSGWFSLPLPPPEIMKIVNTAVVGVVVGTVVGGTIVYFCVGRH